MVALGPFLILLVLVVYFFWSSHRSERPTAERLGVLSEHEAETSADGFPESTKDSSEPPPGAAVSLLPLAPRQVDPAFARVGEPVGTRPFPRGKNQERRFHEPVIRAIPQEAREREAVVLAMSPSDGRVDLLSEEIDAHTKEARRMVLDTSALESVAAGRTARMKVPLPDGSALDLVFQNVRDRGGITQTLDGEVEGEPQKSVAQFVYHDGIVLGSVSRYHIDRHYEYRILPSGHLMVRELDSASMTADCGGSPDASEGDAPNSAVGDAAAEGEEPAPDTAGYTTMDIVVGYDKAARASEGGISQMEAKIIASVDRMNLAFTNSQITQTEIMLLGTIEDPDYVYPGDSSGDMGEELGDLNNTASTNPELNTVSDYANALGADLKAFVLNGADGSAGIAYRPGTSSITARTYMTSTRITFAHEVGHNIGARHSWGDSSGDSSKTVDNYGWRLAPAGQTRVRTIMAYDWGWGSGQRIPYYANPAVTYQGARTGQVNGYNASGDALSDSRYVSGGLEGTHGAGFDGTNASLGARNGPYILAQAPSRANQRARTSFRLVDPAGGVTWMPGQTREIYWTGGDYEDTVTIGLYKSGVFQSQLASGLRGDQRKFSWTIPGGITQGGNYLIRVTRNGSLSADSGLFTIGSAGPQPQTITFNAISNKLTTNTVILSATGGASGNPVTFAVTSGPGVITNGTTLNFTTSGTVEVTASQAGNADYLAATPVTRSIVVTKATATLTLGSLSQVYNGSSRIATASTNPGGLSVALTYDGLSTPPVNAGSYSVAGVINDPIYQGIASGTLVVSKATANVTLSNLNQVYNGLVRPATVTTTPGGLPVTMSYNGFSSAPISAGSYPVNATINHANYTGTANGTLVIAQAPQTIDFSLTPGVIATQTFTLSATGGGSGNAVTYSVTQGPGQITGGNQLSFTGSGEVRVMASQAGNSNFFDATPVEVVLNVTKAPATITLSGLQQVYNGSPRPVAAQTNPTDLPVSVTYDGAATVPVAAGTYAVVATVSDPRYEGSASGDLVVEKAVAEVTLSGLSQTYSGAARTVTAITDPGGLGVEVTYNGSTTPPVNSGTYSVVATVQDASYTGSASGTLTVSKAAQVIGFDPISDQFATDTVLLMASGGGSENPVVFQVTEGPATISGGNSLTFQGEGEVSVRATQAGNANYLDAAAVVRSFFVTRFPATVALSNLNQPYDGTPRPVTVSTSPGGLTVNVTYAGSPNPPTVPGSYFVLAVVDEPYHQGDAGGFLVISKGTQTIDFPTIPDQTATATVNLSATGGASGKPVVYEVTGGPGVLEGNQLGFSGSGTVMVRATQEGDDLYDAATPVERSFTVSKAAATIQLGNLVQTYDGSPKVPEATTIPPGLAVSFTYDGSPDAPSGTGSYSVNAFVADARYEGSEEGTLVVAKAAQLLEFTPPATALATEVISLSATGGGSTSPIGFEVVSGPASIRNGNSLVFSGAGDVTVRANRPGDANHDPAQAVSRTIEVSKATVGGIILERLHQVFDGTAREAVAITTPPGLAVHLTYDGSVDAPVGTGSYEVVAEVDDPIYEGVANGMLVVDDPGPMQIVPGGTHGSSGIAVETFEMGRYEVTWWLWNQVRNWAVTNGYPDLAGIGEGCAGDHPVRGVNWYEAVKWCNARTEWENATLGRHLLPAYQVGGSVYRTGTPAAPDEVTCDRGTSGYRLPDSRESEFAARGGLSSAGTLFPGSEDPILVSWSWWNSEGAACDLDGTRGTHPVGALLPNELGFYDLAGNLAEWLDEGPEENAALRYLAGGHWNSNLSELLPDALTGELPGERSTRGGFRTVRSVSEALAVALDNEDFVWDSGGDSPWFAQTAEHSDGVDGGSSGVVASGGENWVGAIVTGPGTMSFLWRLQAPAGSGSLVLSLDGEEKGRVDASTDWTDHEVYVPAGSHVVRWTYSRSILPDPAPDPLPGPEGAWLDEVAFEPATAPTVESGAVTGVSGGGATVSGEILSDGGSPIEERGFLISTSGGATLDNSYPLVAVGTEPGAFDAVVDSLVSGVTYRMKAYAVNAAGVGYGGERRFTTNEEVEFDNGAAVRVREIAGGDDHVFTFTLSGPRHGVFSTSGGASLRSELYDGEGNLLASSLGDGDFLLSELLYAGNYELRAYRTADQGADQSYTLSFDVSSVAETLPDAAAGASLSSQTGMGIRGIPSLQTVTLVSAKARPVTGYATFVNEGSLPDEFLVSGGRGNSLFSVSYLDDSGNVTAEVIAGSYRTPVIVDGDDPVALRVSVVPNKKKLTKKKGKRTVILKKAIALPLRATSEFDPSIADTAVKVVRTK